MHVLVVSFVATMHKDAGLLHCSHLSPGAEEVLCAIV